MTDRSPFYIVEEFLSPLACEEIIDSLDYTTPDIDKNGHAIKNVREHDYGQAIIYERLMMLLPEVQGYYRFVYKGTHPIEFEWYPEGTHNASHSENSHFLRGKWLREKSRDISGVLFMSDYQEKIPFEQDFEVYGGKLEFPQHAFGFNPVRGTLILFPSDPHFINATTHIMVGELHQARIHMAAKTPFFYNPKEYPGNYTTWFKKILSQK